MEQLLARRRQACCCAPHPHLVPLAASSSEGFHVDRAMIATRNSRVRRTLSRSLT